MLHSIQLTFAFNSLEMTIIYFFFIFRRFIDMGFIDKNRVAIWGWVSLITRNLCSDIMNLTNFILRVVLVAK